MKKPATNGEGTVIHTYKNLKLSIFIFTFYISHPTLKINAKV